MLANLLLSLLLVACGQAQLGLIPPMGPGGIDPNMAVDTAGMQNMAVDTTGRQNMAVDWPGRPNMAVDTAGACNCACASTAEVRMAYQTKYNACVGRGDRHRLYSTEAGRGRGLSRFSCQPLRPWLRVPLRTIRLLLYTRY